LLDNSWDFTEQESNYRTMDEWRSAITIWKAGISTAGIQTSCSWSHVLIFGPLKLGLEEEALASTSPTLMELIGLIGRRTDVCCDGCPALQRRGFSAKLRGNVANFPAMEPVLLGVGFWDSPRTIIKSSTTKQRERKRKCIEQHFPGGSSCEKKKRWSSESRRREGICHCDVLEQSNSFTRSVTQKDSNRITYKSAEEKLE